ncbi:MAG: hypothetical protein Q9Q13_13545, partial [Acidobacteriota bacterium]|nr:hypothetical protein [Acidobacteriota bacterium]
HYKVSLIDPRSGKSRHRAAFFMVTAGGSLPAGGRVFFGPAGALAFFPAGVPDFLPFPPAAFFFTTFLFRGGLAGGFPLRRLLRHLLLGPPSSSPQLLLGDLFLGHLSSLATFFLGRGFPDTLLPGRLLRRRLLPGG